jgi:hypothetical protein
MPQENSTIILFRSQGAILHDLGAPFNMPWKRIEYVPPIRHDIPIC